MSPYWPSYEWQLRGKVGNPSFSFCVASCKHKAVMERTLEMLLWCSKTSTNLFKKDEMPRASHTVSQAHPTHIYKMNCVENPTGLKAFILNGQGFCNYSVIVILLMQIWCFKLILILFLFCHFLWWQIKKGEVVAGEAEPAGSWFGKPLRHTLGGGEVDLASSRGENLVVLRPLQALCMQFRLINWLYCWTVGWALK